MEGENHKLLKTKRKCMLEVKTFETPLTLLSVTTKREKKCDHAAVEKSQAHHSKETVWRWSLKKVVLKNFVKFAVETPAMEFYF